MYKHIFILLFQTCLQCPVIQCQFTKYEKSAEAFWLQWFNLFAFYWSMNFVTAFGELVLAGVFATWYWTWDKSTVPCCVLGTSMVYAIFFHLVRFLTYQLYRLTKKIVNFGIAHRKRPGYFFWKLQLHSSLF